MSLKIFLLILAIIIPSIGEIKEEYRNKWLRLSTILMIILAAIFQFKDDRAKEDQRVKEYNTTIANGNATLKGIGVASQSISKIQRDVQSQLDSLKKLDSSSKILFSKNQVITKNLKGVSENIDNIVLPLFPATIYITLKVPLADQWGMDLKRDIDSIKKVIEFHPKTEFPDIEINRAYNGEVYSFYLLYPEKQLSHYGFGELKEYSKFGVSLAKTDRGLNNINRNTPQMNFKLDEFNNNYRSFSRSLTIDYLRKIMTIRSVFIHQEYYPFSFDGLMNGSNTVFNTNNLVGCYFRIHSYTEKPYISDVIFEIRDIVFKEYAFKFSDYGKKQTHKSLLFQVHKITPSDSK